MIHRKPVPSSFLEWIGWPTTGEPLMVVAFQNGKRYGYLGVSRQRAVACTTAQSVGSYYARRIKGHYTAVQLKDREVA